MGLLKLYNVVPSQLLVQNDASVLPASLPGFVQADVVTVEFMALMPSGRVAAPWTRILPSAYSLAIGLYSAAGALIAYQNSWTPASIDGTGNTIYTGSLVQDSGAFTTAVAAATLASPAAGFLNVIITDGAGNAFTSLPASPVLLRKNATGAGASSVIPPDVAATQSWALASFVRNDGPAGAIQIIRSPAGYQFKFWVDDNGTPHFDRIV